MYIWDNSEEVNMMKANQKDNIQVGCTANSKQPDHGEYTMYQVACSTLIQIEKLLLWICLMSRLVYPIMSLNVVSANIFFPLGRMLEWLQTAVIWS